VFFNCAEGLRILSQTNEAICLGIQVIFTCKYLLVARNMLSYMVGNLQTHQSQTTVMVFSGFILGLVATSYIAYLATVLTVGQNGSISYIELGF
jgi:uncharacterized membrane protein